MVVLLPAALGVLYRAYRLALLDKEEFVARSSAVIEHALDGTITINDSAIIESVNPSVVDLFGYLMTELLGVNIDTLVPEVYGKDDKYLKTLSRSSGGNVIDSGRELMGRHKDSSTFRIRFRFSEVFFGGKRLFTAMIHDLTHESELEQQLAHSQKMEAVGQLTGGVAHDFNNLLAVISGNLELAMDNGLEKDTQSLLRRAMAAVDKGADLTRQLLVF